MGANHQKEIEFHVLMHNPPMELSPMLAKAHLEGFEGFKGVMAGKKVNYMLIFKKKQSGKSFHRNHDNNPSLMEMSRTCDLGANYLLRHWKR